MDVQIQENNDLLINLHDEPKDEKKVNPQSR